jgi:hypothetical protein
MWQSVWRWSVLVLIVAIPTWWIAGSLLSIKFLDKSAFNAFKLLNSRADSLVYVSLLFAVQIPLFILLLQRMIESGYIKRRTLPVVVYFREVLTAYVILSLLLLLSKRASYYYFPVLVLSILSLYVLYISVKVMFETRKLKRQEDNYITKLVSQIFRDGMGARKLSNDFQKQLDALKTPSYVTHIFKEMLTDKKDFAVFAVRSKDDGLIKSINLSGINELMSERFSNINVEESSNLSKSTEQNIKVYQKAMLSVRPGAVVERDSELMTLYFKKDDEAPSSKFINKLIKTFDITPISPDSAAKRAEELISDFKQQLRMSIEKDDPSMIEEALNFYKLFTKGLVNFGDDDESPDYTLKNARQEYDEFFVDSVGKSLQDVANILNNNVIFAFKLKREDTTHDLLQFLYRDLMNVTNNYDEISVARADKSFISAIRSLILSEQNNIKFSKIHHQFFDYLTFRLEEHTSILLYKIRDQEKYSKEYSRWIYFRVDDIRGLLMSAYKNPRDSMFNKLFKTVDRVEQEDNYYPEETQKFIDYLRCNIFVISAYINRQTTQQNEQIQIVEKLQNYIYYLSPIDITSLLIECTEKNYIDKWRLDMYDYHEPRVMYQVPDLHGALKDLWIGFMLKKGVMDVNYYSSLALESTTVFTGGLSSIKDNYLLNAIDKLPDTEKNKQALSDLVKAFIKKRMDWEEDELASKSISTKLVKEFQEGTRNSFRKQSSLFNLFEKLEKVRYVKNADTNFYNLGVNQVMDKQFFIEDSGYYMPLDHFGSDIAVASDQYLLDRIVADAKGVNNIKEFLKSIRGSKNQWVIVLRNMSGWYIYKQFEKELKSSTDYDNIYFKDVDQVVPVQVIYDRTNNKGLYAISKKDLGKLSVREYDDQFMQVQVTSFAQNNTALEQMLADQPQWLSDMYDNDEDRKKYLLTKIRMLINFTFIYRRYRQEGKVYFVPLDEGRL